MDQMNNAVSMQTLITVIGFAITIYTFTNNRKKDIEQDTASKTKMYTKIDATCNQINEILRSVDRMTDKFDDVSHRQSRHDEQIKSMSKQIDAHEERINKLEEK